MTCAARTVFVFGAYLIATAAVLIGFTGLAAASLAPATLIGFAVVDALGALWTWSALRATRTA